MQPIRLQDFGRGIQIDESDGWISIFNILDAICFDRALLGENGMLKSSFLIGQFKSRDKNPAIWLVTSQIRPVLTVKKQLFHV